MTGPADDDVRTFFKPGTGDQPAKVDTRRSVPGSSLKVRDGYQLKGKRKPKRPPVRQAIWAAVKVEVIHRARGECEARGIHHPRCSGRAEHVHHIIIEQHGGPDDVDNGLAVSAECHAQIHSATGMAKATAHGFLYVKRRWRTGDPLPWQGGRIVIMSDEAEHNGEDDETEHNGEDSE